MDILAIMFYGWIDASMEGWVYRWMDGRMGV